MAKSWAEAGSEQVACPPPKENQHLLLGLSWAQAMGLALWKCRQIYMVLFTGLVPISDTLKLPYMTHCCSDNKQVISWVGGQPPAGFHSLFLNQLERLIKSQGPLCKAQETPRARGRWSVHGPRLGSLCHLASPVTTHCLTLGWGTNCQGSPALSEGPSLQMRKQAPLEGLEAQLAGGTPRPSPELMARPGMSEGLVSMNPNTEREKKEKKLHI